MKDIKLDRSGTENDINVKVNEVKHLVQNLPPNVQVKIHDICDVLSKTVQAENTLVKKCEELNNNLNEQTTVSNSTLKLYKNQQETFSKLKKELEVSWKQNEAVVQTIAREKAENDSLRALISAAENRTNKFILGKQEAEREFTALSAKNEKLLNKIQILTDEKNQLLKAGEEMEGKCTQVDKKYRIEHEQLKTLNLECKDYKVLCQKFETQKQSLQQENKILQEKVYSYEAMIDSKENECRKNNTQIYELSKFKENTKNLIVALKAKNVRLTNDCISLQDKIISKTRNIEAHSIELEGLKTKVSSLKDEMVLRNTRVVTLEKELRSERKRCTSVENQLSSCRSSNLSCKVDLKAYADAAAESKTLIEKYLKEVERLKREKNVIKENMHKQNNYISKAKIERKTLQQETVSLQSDLIIYEKKISLHNAETKKMKNFQSSCEKAAMKYKKKAEEISVACQQSNNLVSSEKKRHRILLSKLSQTQHMYEQVLAQKNVLCKQLLECNEVIAEQKRRQHIVQHQVEQLKEEISAKDKALIKEDIFHKKYFKRENDLKMEISRVKSLKTDNEKIILQQKNSITKFTAITKRLDIDIQTLKREIENITREREQLKKKLMKCEDHLLVLEESNRDQEITIQRGNYEYNLCLKERKMFLSKISELKSKLIYNAQAAVENKDLNRQLILQEKQIQVQELRAESLAQELESPLNIHRYRFLQNTDPTYYNLKLKVSSLQKRLLRKNQESLTNKVLLEEKYEEVKQLSALNNNNFSETYQVLVTELSEVKKSMLQKSRALNAARAELSLYRENRLSR